MSVKVAHDAEEKVHRALRRLDQVKQVKPLRRLVWGGPANGIAAVHVWTFTPTRHGVLVHTEESWAGAPVEADIPYAQGALDASLRGWLENLKRTTEARS